MKKIFQLISLKKLRERLKLFLISMVVWFMLTLEISISNMALGTLLSLIITGISYTVLYDRKENPFKEVKVCHLLKFSLSLFVEIYKSSFLHILRIIKKDENPMIYEVVLSVENPYIITMISNAITLTPGTITVDTEKNKLYVLTINGNNDSQESLEEDIKQKFEKPFSGGCDRF